MSHKFFIKYSWFLVGVVFLVILAGGVVRMTQSGMGCPDWPRCFGSWIPPLNESQLPPDFVKYLDKQDIDHSFNVYHTWIEYINRLLGAILGLFILINMWYATRYFRKSHKSIFLLSLAMVILVGFEGWLGKLVVDSNLSVLKITIHMLAAIVIAFIPLINISILKPDKIKVPSSLKLGLLILMGLLTVQIILGTQVREQIDIISKSYSYESRELWISGLDYMFVVHRSFSWLVLLLAAFLWWKGRTIKEFVPFTRFILFTLLVIILLGIVMAYLNMPAIAQPTHLLLACGVLVGVFYTRLRLE